MASTAISAQGSTFQVSTGTGIGKTITVAAVGNPTILTSSAHGFSNGDVVAIAGVTGADAALLNGLSFVVQSKTINTFALAVDTTGKTITASGTATPNTYTSVANINTFSGFDGQASEIDATNLGSTAKEFLIGIPDSGQFMVEVDQDFSDNGQNALRAAQTASASKNFKLNLPNGKVASFTGFVKKISTAGGVDAVIKSSVDIRISGAITIA